MSEGSRGRPVGMAALLLLAAALFCALGVWQVQRRSWKLGLIAEVDARVEAPAAPAPPPAAWPGVTAQADAYRHVRVRGVLLADRQTLVRAATGRGEGDWVVTPLRTEGGWTVLVNRGFVPDDPPPLAGPFGATPAGPVTVTGLLRISEPGGGFLRANDPAHDRWYSRDVAAIARARGLGQVAPYFIDADASPDPGGYPVGGLTVVSFPNNHLVYAITWFSLAALSLFGLRALRRDAAAGAAA